MLTAQKLEVMERGHGVMIMRDLIFIVHFVSFVFLSLVNFFLQINISLLAIPMIFI